MATTKIFFHSNIRFLRERRGFSQEDFAQLVGLKRITLQALESGRTKNPTTLDLLKFSEEFKISVDSLLKVDLSKLGELQLRELEAGNDVYMMGTKIRVLPLTLDKDNYQNSEYVPVKAKMGYRTGFTDPSFIASLPKFNIPSLPRHGTYRTFPASGDSMLPIPENAEVTGEYVENWLDLKPDTPCVMVLNGTADFVFKLVTVNKAEKSFTLKSLNPVYKPYTVTAAEVLEVWKFKKLHLDELPEAPTDLQELKTMILELRAVVEHGKK